MDIIIFEKVCLYDTLKDVTTIYGRSSLKFNRIFINNLLFRLIFSTEEDPAEFYINLKGKIYTIESIIFFEHTAVLGKKIIHIRKNIKLYFPFENCDLQLNSSSAIICTMCKDYLFRLDEWIKYNLNLGFSGIVIFNNSDNKSNVLNESLKYSVQTSTMEEICNKYKGRVWVVDMPYSPLKDQHWNTIQRFALHIGVNEFRNKCRNIALIDADEFIYLPNKTHIKIEDFLQNYSTITLQSNILTNKNDNDLLNNNILQLAKYVGEDKYMKTILHTDKITENEFIDGPHTHHSQTIMNKNDIIHYHCWMNERYKYNKNMPTIDISPQHS